MRILQRVSQLTLASSLKTLPLTLWDEQEQRLVTFREATQAATAATGQPLKATAAGTD